MCAYPLLPLHEQFRTSGLPDMSGPSSRQSQHDASSSGACAVVMVVMVVAALSCLNQVEARVRIAGAKIFAGPSFNLSYPKDR